MRLYRSLSQEKESSGVRTSALIGMLTIRPQMAATIAAILLGGSSDVVSTVLLAGEYVR